MTFYKSISIYFFWAIVIFVIITKNLFAIGDTTSNKAVKDPSIIMKRINEVSKSIKSIECEFIQIKHLSYLSENVTSKGAFYYKRENLIRWEYTSPYKYIIAVKKDKFIMKDGETISSFDIKSNELFSELNDIILGCIKSDILKSETKFKFSFFETGSVYLIKLTPVAPNIKEIFKSIEIYFNKSNFDLTDLKMIENTGDFTKIQFINRKYNININEEIFYIK